MEKGCLPDGYGEESDDLDNEEADEKEGLFDELDDEGEDLLYGNDLADDNIDNDEDNN